MTISARVRSTFRLTSWRQPTAATALSDPVRMTAFGEFRVPRLGLIAHDHKKLVLLQWASEHIELLTACELVATGTTGLRLQRDLGLGVECLRSGPMGGDLQMGARIAEGRLDALIFFWDPLQPQPHDPDVRALLRAATVWDVPTACNRATADMVATALARGGPAWSATQRPLDVAAVDQPAVAGLVRENRSVGGDHEGVDGLQ